MYNKQTDQRTSIKKTFDYENIKRKRGERMSKLRKKRIDQHLAKRRRETTGGRYDTEIIEKLKMLPELIQKIQSGDEKTILMSTTYLRQLLSMDKAPPIDEVVKSDVVPVLVSFLKRNDFPALQFEALWALTNISSGTEYHTGCVLKANAVPHFIQCLSSKDSQVSEQAIWALGNIAGDSAKARDYLLSCNIISPIIAIIEKNPPISKLRNAVWLLSNLCRGKPIPKFEYVLKLIPTLSFLIHNSDVEVLTDSCWAVSYISDGPNIRIQAIIENHFVKRLVELLTHSQSCIQTPALRTIGNIVTGNDEQTQHCIQCGLLGALRNLLNHSRKSIRKEALWTISNISAGHPKQLKKVIDAKIFPLIFKNFQISDFDIKRESTWCLTNAIQTANLTQCHILVRLGAIQILCSLLDIDDATTILLGLGGIETILKNGKYIAQEKNIKNPYKQIVEKCDGLKHLENLQSHDVDEIYKKAYSILVDYFDVVENEHFDEEYSFMKQIQPNQTNNYNF